MVLGADHVRMALWREGRESILWPSVRDDQTTRERRVGADPESRCCDAPRRNRTAGGGVMNDPDDEDPCVVVCAGPPVCLLVDDAAVAAARGGCVWCTRITLHPDGSETVREPAQC